MQHIRFQGNRLSGSGGLHFIWACWPSGLRDLVQTLFFHLLLGGCIRNLNENGTVVSEEKHSENVSNN